MAYLALKKNEDNEPLRLPHRKTQFHRMTFSANAYILYRELAGYHAVERANFCVISPCMSLIAKLSINFVSTLT